MNPTMKKALDELTQLVKGSPTTKGLLLRVRGKILTLSRPFSTPEGGTDVDDRVRLTHLGGGAFGLSVMRHTGKWEKTPLHQGNRMLTPRRCYIRSRAGKTRVGPVRLESQEFPQSTTFDTDRVVHWPPEAEHQEMPQPRALSVRLPCVPPIEDWREPTTLRRLAATRTGAPSSGALVVAAWRSPAPHRPKGLEVYHPTTWHCTATGIGSYCAAVATATTCDEVSRASARNHPPASGVSPIHHRGFTGTSNAPPRLRLGQGEAARGHTPACPPLTIRSRRYGSARVLDTRHQRGATWSGG